MLRQVVSISTGSVRKFGSSASVCSRVLAPSARRGAMVARQLHSKLRSFPSAPINAISSPTKVNARFMSSVDVSPLAMPSLSPTMQHGTISLWKAKPGTELKAGDVVCEIETDKASVGFEMQENCVLAKILVEAHSAEVQVGMPIALTVEDMDAYNAFVKVDPSSYKHLEGGAASVAQTPAASNTAAPSSSAAAHTPVAVAAGEQKFMPAARHMAESQGLNTSAVVGTAKGGRISKGDLVLGLKAGIVTAGGRKHAPKHVAAQPQVAPMQSAAAAAAAPAPAVVGTPVNDRYTDIPNSNMRKVIAKRLTESKATVPHFYTSIECEIDKLMALRKTMKKEYDQNLSVNDLVIKSAALALRDVPEANARWNKATSSIDASTCRNVDISVAVATPSGLITPILTGADKRGLADINSTVRDLATRARDGKLKPEEYQGGSFSISNLGMYGITAFSAVINPPQACILAVGAGIQKVMPPLPGGDRPRVVTTVTVQLSADRRVVDEATAAQFLQVFQNYLSNPQAILL